MSVTSEAPAFNQAGKSAGITEISTAEYINRAVAYYKRTLERQLLAKQLAEKGLLCREESTGVRAEFERF